MFKKILIANRGEIAVRIIRACRELGIQCAAIYSTADKNSLHVKLADEAYEIGPPDPLQSYLDIDKIIELAMRVKADAIHPGYGFLSENPKFALACEKNGIIFIGPKSNVLENAGDKLKARTKISKAGVLVIPGTLRTIDNLKEATKIAKRLGFPVVIKPADGGGGIGIRIARNARELKKYFREARQEAFKAFGSDRVYIEKVICRAKHIEMQIVADNYGNIVWLGERDCSIQRRHQKIIEETPSPALNDDEREKLGELAIKAAKAIDYNNVGTVEFLYKDGKFYFLEINARLQVEHGITEIVTGIDLVHEQVRLAYGEELGFSQKDVKIRGWAIEARITAEDPLHQFAPSPGKIIYYEEPGGMGIRVDSHLYRGYEIPPFYDSLISKLIAWGRNRTEAIKRLRRGLSEYIISGIKTTIPLLRKITETEEFLNGTYDTMFLTSKLKDFIEEIIEEEYRKMAAIAAIMVINNNISAQKSQQKKEAGSTNSKKSRSPNIGYVVHQLSRWAKKISSWKKSSFFTSYY